MHKYSAILAVSLAFMASIPASAEEKNVPISYHDLNLTSVEGRAALDRRLDNAARNVCSAHGTYDLAKKDVSRRCHEAALNDARQQAQIVVAQAKSGNEVAAK